MSYSLHETLNRIDRYVKLNDGCSVRTVEQVLTAVGYDDSEEYAMFSDVDGRLLIYRLGDKGHPIRPAAFIEEKLPAAFSAARRKPLPA